MNKLLTISAFLFTSLVFSRPSGVYFSVGETGRFSKSRVETEQVNFSVERPFAATTLRLEAKGDAVNIQEVEITYRSGQIESFYQPTNNADFNLYEEEKVVLELDGSRKISDIRITAQSAIIWGSRARVAVEAIEGSSNPRDPRDPSRPDRGFKTMGDTHKFSNERVVTRDVIQQSRETVIAKRLRFTAKKAGVRIDSVEVTFANGSTRIFTSQNFESRVRRNESTDIVLNNQRRVSRVRVTGKTFKNSNSRGFLTVSYKSSSDDRDDDDRRPRPPRDGAPDTSYKLECRDNGTSHQPYNIQTRRYIGSINYGYFYASECRDAVVSSRQDMVCNFNGSNYSVYDLNYGRLLGNYNQGYATTYDCNHAVRESRNLYVCAFNGSTYQPYDSTTYQFVGSYNSGFNVISDCVKAVQASNRNEVCNYNNFSGRYSIYNRNNPRNPRGDFRNLRECTRALSRN